MISALVRSHEAGAPLSDEELLAFCFVLLAAGLETTMYFLANAVRTLIARPQDLPHLAENFARIPVFLEEVLRYDSPGHGTFRIATQPVELAGTKIGAGEVLLLLMASSSRDERKFRDADSFDMHRTYDRGLAFGHGIHFCLGAPLARLEARIAMEELMPIFRRAAIQTGGVEWNLSLTVRGPVHLPLALAPHA
jgi:cytochrome P450